ncbi:hypothetical protein [Actinoplanes sp. CA-252034]|uniref:hypothetical protein n=1 Tax=Actinoplanes sp. CA-252034 TaxID=3239906 RepID=UPI003D97379E
MAGIRRISYVLEQESPGVWCASAFIRPGVGLMEDGPTPEAAVEELRESLTFVVGEVELTRVAKLGDTA